MDKERVTWGGSEGALVYRVVRQGLWGGDSCVKTCLWGGAALGRAERGVLQAGRPQGTAAGGAGLSCGGPEERWLWCSEPGRKLALDVAQQVSMEHMASEQHHS